MKDNRVLLFLLIILLAGCGSEKLLSGANKSKRTSSSSEESVTKERDDITPVEPDKKVPSEIDRVVQGPKKPQNARERHESNARLIANKKVLKNGDKVNFKILVEKEGEKFSIESFDWPPQMGENLFSVDASGTYVAANISETRDFNPQVMYDQEILTDSVFLQSSKKKKSILRGCLWGLCND